MFARTYRGAVRQQLRLRERLAVRGDPKRVRAVAGADLSYEKHGDRFYAAVVLLSWPDLEVIEEATAVGRSPFPYIPGLLSYREGPLLLRAFRTLRRRPDLVVFDGHGIAHPRGFGIASHMGVLLDIPSIGCAKTRLVGEHAEPSTERGAMEPLRVQGRRVGMVVRTRTGVRPVFASPGHRIGIPAAVRWVLRLGDGFRLPKPTRLAHNLSNRLRRSARRPR